MWRAVVDALAELRRTLFGYDIFISYASTDQAFAKALHETLKKRYTVFFDKTSGVTATPLATLLRASSRSRMVLVVLTPAAAASGWVADELDAHLNSAGVARVAAIFASAALLHEPPPRLASLSRYGGIRVSPDDLEAGIVRPETQAAIGSTFSKIRRAAVLEGTAALLTLSAAMACGLFLYMTPGWAWTKTDVSELDTDEAILSPNDPSGLEVWALTGGYHLKSLDDDSGGVTYESVVSLDRRGGIAGCMGFNRSEGGIAPAADACAPFGPLGVFTQQSEALNRKWRQLFDKFDPWRDLAGPRALEKPSQSEQEQLLAIARTASGTAVSGNPGAETRPRVFSLGAHGRLAFVMFTSDSGSRVVPLRSKDGSTWTAGQAASIDVSDAPDIAIGSQDADVLYVATRDHRVAGEAYGLPGGVFRSTDGGLTWRALSLPPPWTTWQSFSSVRATSGVPSIIAVAIAPTHMGAGVRPAGAPGVITSSDGGERWTALATGFRIAEGRYVDLVGVAPTGQVSALVRQQAEPSKGGSLIEWRRLSLLERLRGAYGL